MTVSLDFLPQICVGRKSFAQHSSFLTKMLKFRTLLPVVLLFSAYISYMEGSSFIQLSGFTYMESAYSIIRKFTRSEFFLRRNVPNSPLNAFNIFIFIIKWFLLPKNRLFDKIRQNRNFRILKSLLKNKLNCIFLFFQRIYSKFVWQKIWSWN